MKRSALATLALAFTLLAPPRAHAQFDPSPAGERSVARASAANARVSPRSFNFTDLPVRGPSENLPIQDGPDREWKAYEAVIAALKANPPALAATAASPFTLDSTLPPANGKGSFSPLAPTLGTGFEGITQGGFIPGEPTVGGGPLNIFSAGNISVTVTNKDGSNRAEINGATFFGVPAAEGAVSDAQCYYDALRGRFVALCFTQGTAPSNFSNFYLVISKTNDARGAWWQYKFDMTLDGVTPTANWSDYQGLGISDDKMVFSAQQFAFAAGNAYSHSKFRVLDRVAAYNGSPLTYVDFAPVAAPPGGNSNDVFVTKPARNLTAGDNTIHCMCVSTSGNSHITYRTITGPPSAPVLSAGNLVTVASYSPPPDAPQLGSAALVATNDCRPTDFYVRNGVLIAAWHTAANISATTVGAIRLFRMRTSDRAVLTDETFGQASTFYYYPAVVVDSVGTIFLGFGRSSSTERPSVYATGKRRSDTTLQPSALLKAGLTATAQTRWGDYTGIDQDAALTGPGQTTAWYVGQWTKATNTFGTWVNKLSYTYGEVFGTVADDCDGSAATTADRTAIAGVSVALKQGATTVASTTTNALGQYSFGYLESGTYDVVVTPPAGGTSVDAVAGAGATTQTRVSASDVQIVITNAQQSSANTFAVASTKPLAATSLLTPSTRSVGDPQFTLTVDGSNFANCSVVRIDGAARPTTFVSSTQVTATITALDQGAGGSKTITVFTPTPGGGLSNGQTLTILGTPDTQSPVVTVTAPVGGEAWAAASVHAITWTATDNVGVASVDLAWSSDGGVTFPNAIATATANTGTFNWTVPVVLTNSARVRVFARDGSGNVASDSSHANFAITGFTVTASAGPNGSIVPLGVLGVADGATPSYTITPNAGYHIASVLVNGSTVGLVTNFTFPPVHANQTIAATFAINTYALSLLTTGSGSVAAVPNQATYDHGTVVQLTATPAVSWYFDFWNIDVAGNANPLSVTMDGPKVIGANFGQHQYVWVASGSTVWTTAANWSPPRTLPAANDVLIFTNNGASATATSVPTQTLGQLSVEANTSITLQAAAAATLTVSGGLGADLSVATGATLSLTGANAVTIAIGSGATGSIQGITNLAGGAHRLTAVDLGSLVYASGAVCVAGTSFSGNTFGSTSLNSVVFNAGSLYQHVAGANPFGATAPNSVVTFIAGSRYRLDGALTPSMSGRTYADFEYNNNAAVLVTGGTAVTMDSLVVTKGALNLNLVGGVIVRGDVHVKTPATLGFSPASGTPSFAMSGSSAQSIDIQGTLVGSSNGVLSVNNPAGVTLLNFLSWPGNLSFSSGRINTGSNPLILAAGSTLSGASQGTGWVNGNLNQNYAAGAFASTLAVGDALTYAPIDVSGTGAGVGFNLMASTAAGDHPNLATSGLVPTRSANRRWTLVPANATGATWFATFNFAASDLDLTADPLTFAARVYNGAAWSALPVNAQTSSFTQVSGLSSATAGTQFALGNLPTFTITASAGAGGVISPTGAVSVPQNGNQSFAMLPNPGFHVVDVLVDGVSVGAVVGFPFTNVTANHTIAASFAGDARTLTLSVVGGGSVTKAPDLPTYPHGSTVQLTAIPAVGWAFAAWSGDLIGTTNPDNLLMDDVKAVTSTFLDIAAPTVAVSAPNGGEVVTVGTGAVLNWSAADNAAVTAIDLDLSRAGVGGPFEVIATGIVNTGSFNWTVTGPTTANARVRATAHDAAAHTAADLSDADFSIADPTGVNDGLVADFALSPVWPNPVRGSTRFQFALPRDANVHMSVHDVQGRELLLLADGTFPAGRHSVDWASSAQSSLDSGLYFVRLTVPGRTMVRRFVLMR